MKRGTEREDGRDNGDENKVRRGNGKEGRRIQREAGKKDKKDGQRKMLLKKMRSK